MTSPNILGITMMVVGLTSIDTSVYSLIPIASGELLGIENMPSAVSINWFSEGIGNIQCR